LTSDPSWRDCDKVRFKAGQPEKIGGWSALNTTGSLSGIARSTHTWRLNNGIIVTAIGTHEKLHLLRDANITDITPIRQTGLLGADPFDATSGSTTVTVTHNTHGATNNDYVTFSGAVCAVLEDSEVNANHQITYVDANTYTFEVTTPATGTDAADGGASVNGAYEISVGNASSASDYGYGAGAYSREEYGDARTIGGIDIELRFWSLDNFGEDLVVCHEAGRVYRWTYAGNFTDRAVVQSNSPPTSDFLIVTSPDRHLVVFSTDTAGTHNKLLLAWADRETTNTWTPTAENTAGDQVISTGSQLMTARKTQNGTLIWTDIGLHFMEHIGAPFTFGFSEIGHHCGAVSRMCVVSRDTMIYWMGKDNFYVYDGVVSILPCTVHRHVFKNITRTQTSKIIGGFIEEFDEIIWFYPSASDNENDKYVIYNYLQKIWYIGTMQRTAWENAELINYPRGIDNNGNIYDHELTSDDNGSAITAYIESSDFDVAEGDKAYLISELIPDMAITSGSVDYILKTKRYPHSTQVSDTTKTVSATTESINLRIRSKILALRIESDALGDNWRMGRSRVAIRPDGVRP
jgi:hypothetical protein